MVVLIGHCHRGGKRRSFRRRGISVVDMVAEKLFVALFGGWGGREREGKRDCRNGAVRGWFFVNFGLDFLLPQAINSTSIYRRWKRAILSTQEKISAFDSIGKDPNHWFKVSILSSQFCRKSCMSRHV